MHTRPRYSPVRRVLFPYSGEEPLTLLQSLRVIGTWALLFPLGMVLITLVITLLRSYSINEMLMLLLIMFLSGVGIFGGLALLLVAMGNRAARIYQARSATKPSSAPGGRYGS